MIPKFRAWEHDVKYMNDQVRITYNNFGSNKIFVEVTEGFGWKDVDEKYLMQSTGLHDVNGKEIFEGDIVQCWYEKGFVVMRQGSWFIETDKEHLGALYEYSDEARVIGNIHEHPELLIQPKQ
ncbi:YopX family protein [Macrococcus psychrotolerans]|uniref:YopX family protein n=1 Tax=Macrococcus psychrotolerans TaxID=3039389 RepID=A0AAU6RH12_9STAP